MSELEANVLLPTDRMREQALAGEVTQIHRGQQYAEVGDTFTVDETTFEVTAVSHRTLGDVTDEDARAEGVADLEAYKSLLERAHDHFTWCDDSEIVLHRFEQI